MGDGDLGAREGPSSRAGWRGCVAGPLQGRSEVEAELVSIAGEGCRSRARQFIFQPTPDIRYKMGEKARRGGTLGRAPLGYLNVRESFEGREVRTVKVDEERAPFIKLAFELYGTGQYTLDTLLDTLTTRGLRSRPGKHPAKPISRSHLQRILRDRYYIGVVMFDGVEYPGRHEPLISLEEFQLVQRALDAKAQSSERHRVHHHYLKGSIYCGRCHEEGRQSRLVVTRAVGRRGGEYFYFFCPARRDHPCTLPYLDTDRVEDAIIDYYRTIQFAPDFAARVRQCMAAALDDRERSTRLLDKQLRAQVAKLERQEEHLLDLAADGEMDKERVKARILKVQQERQQVTEQLIGIDNKLEVGFALLDAALTLMEDPAELYCQAGPNERRLLNQAIFERMYVDTDDTIEGVLAEPFAELHEAERRLSGVEGKTYKRTASPNGLATRADLLVAAILGGGSNKNYLVEVMGLEPTTSTLRT